MKRFLGLMLLPTLTLFPWMREVDEKNFDQVVLESKEPIVVDFYATWCGACRRMKPVVKELSEEYEGKVNFALINVDRSKELRQKYDIKLIPTFYFIKDGIKLEHKTGSMSKNDFKQKIESNFDL